MDDNAEGRSEFAPGPPADLPSQMLGADGAPPSEHDEAPALQKLNEESEQVVAGADPSSTTVQASSSSTPAAPDPHSIPDQVPSYSQIQVQPCDTHGV